MPSIISYRKYIDAQVTRELSLPEDSAHQRLGTELATVEGVTYVCLPDGATLPTEQPSEIAASIATVTLTDVLRDAIKAESPHCALISARMQEQIRARYSLDDEQYFARIGVGAALGAYAFETGEREALLAFGAHVENARLWGRTERAKLGL